MPVAELPDLDHVFAKWEKRGPPQGTNWNSRGPDRESNVELSTDQVIDSGRKKWQQKFQGQNLQPLHRRRLKERNRSVAVSAETVQSNIIAQFKTMPTIMPELFIVSRPLMGHCCNCMPNSQRDFQFGACSNEGIRNLLDVKHELRNDGPVHRQFATLVYSWRTRTSHKFPDLSMAVLANKRLVEVIQQELLAQDVKKERARLEKRSREILNAMKARVVNALTKFSGWFLHHFLGLLLSSVYVHKGQIKVIKTAAERGLPIVYLPLHKSHLDYILVTWVLWNYSIKSPHIAAGDNLKIPFFSHVSQGGDAAVLITSSESSHFLPTRLKKNILDQTSMLMNGLGAFFIRRKLDVSKQKKDALYRAVLHSYMEELLRHSEPLEFFIEGGRSRTGKALPPKGGLLSVILESVSKGITEDVYIVPVSISYEKIVDGNFNDELMGIPKKKETFFGALKGIWSVLKGHYGSVRVDFAQPFSMREFMLNIQPPSPVESPDSGASDMSSSPPNIMLRRESNTSLFGSEVSDDQRHIVDNLGQHIVHCCNQTTALMCSNLLAFLMLTKHRQGVTLRELKGDYCWLREEIIVRKRDVGFSPVSGVDDVIFYTANLLGSELISTRPDNNHVETVFYPTTTIPGVFELSYYSNPVIYVFLLESVLVSSVIYLSDINVSTLECSVEEEVILMSREEILEMAEDLCKILKYEFIFVPPCTSLEDKLSDVLDVLITTEILRVEDSTQFDQYQNENDKQWASRLSASLSWADDGDDEEDYFAAEQLLRVNIEREDCREKLRFFHRVLAPFFEAYLVTAHHISKIVEEIPDDDFIKNLHHHAKERVTNEIATYGESASLETLKNAVKSFKDLKIIESYKTSNLAIMDLRDHYNVKDRLHHYLNMLQSLRD